MFDLEPGKPFPTLFEIAQDSLIRHVKYTKNVDFTDIGYLPWSRIGPVLSKLENANTLEAIEANSPHIVEHTPELWQSFIRRDFGIDSLQPYLTRSKPIKNSNWSKLYRRLEQNHKEKEQEDIDALKAMTSLQDAIKEKRKTAMATVRREDVSQLRRLDRGGGGGGPMGGWRNLNQISSGRKEPESKGPFRSGVLNKVIAKGRPSGFGKVRR